MTVTDEYDRGCKLKHKANHASRSAIYMMLRTQHDTWLGSLGSVMNWSVGRVR